MDIYSHSTRTRRWIIALMLVDLLNAVNLDGTKYDQWLIEPYSSDIAYTIEDAEKFEETNCAECAEEYQHNCTEEYARLWSTFSDTSQWWSSADSKADNDVTLSCNNFESPELIQHQGTAANEDMVIYINRVYYGRDDTHECGEREQDEYCQVSASEQMFKLVECNGQSECTHMVYPHAITCPSGGGTQQDAHFLRVDYQCIKENNIYEMDGTIDEIGTTGYLLSQNYPDVYPANTNYECRFSIPTHNVLSALSFDVLDFALQDQENGECQNDYIEFQEINTDSNSIRNERRFCSSQQSGYIYSTSSKTARIVFKTDSIYQRRGFWLRYSANSVTQPVQSLNVQVNCRHFDPNEAGLPTYESDIPEINPEPSTTTTSTTTEEPSNEVTARPVTTTTTTTTTTTKRAPAILAKTADSNSHTGKSDIPSARNRVPSQDELSDSSSSDSNSSERDEGGGDSEVIVIVSVIAGALLLIGIIIGSVFLRRKFRDDDTLPMTAAERKHNSYNGSNGSLKSNKSNRMNGSLDNPGYGKPQPPPRGKLFIPSHSDSVLNSITSANSDGYMTPISEDAEENVYELIVGELKKNRSNGHTPRDTPRDTPNSSITMEKNNNGDAKVYYEHEYADIRA